MTDLWTTEELPGRAADPVPAPDDDGPWCASGLLPEQREHMTTLDVQGDLL